MDAVAGARLRCAICSTEVVVLVADEPELTCCGAPLTPLYVPSNEDGDGDG